MIILPALESPHSGGAGKNFFHYVIWFSVRQLYTCAASVQHEQYQPNLYIAHLSRTWFQLHLARCHGFAAMVNWLCHFTPDDTVRGTVTLALFSLKDVWVCVCARVGVHACVCVGGGVMVVAVVVVVDIAVLLHVHGLRKSNSQTQ